MLSRKQDRDPIPTWLISSPSTIYWAVHSFFTDCYHFSYIPSFPKGIALFLGSLLGSTARLFFPCPTPHCLNYSSSLYLAIWDSKPSYFVHLSNCLSPLLFHTSFGIHLICFIDKNCWGYKLKYFLNNRAF